MLLKKKPKVTLIVHDLSINPIVRAYPFYLALKKLGYDVEIVGFLIRKNEIYPPYKRKASFKTVVVKNPGLWEYLKGLPKLLSLIEGDIIYAFKPRMTSYFPGLIKSFFGLRKPLLLDAEDDELYFEYSGPLNFLYLFFVRGWLFPNAHKYLLILHLFLFPTPKKTVVSSKLKKRYGGDIILHGPDESIFDPKLYDKSSCRKKFLIENDKKVILFAGVPHDHKGIDIIIEALSKINEDDFLFVCAGPKNHTNFKYAKEKLGNKCRLLGNVPNEKMPELLAASDIVPILQKETKFTESQMPAKLFEAMAMEKIIIATDVSDIGFVLGKNEGDSRRRGYILESNNVDSLIKKLKILKNLSEAKKYAENARLFYLENASVAAISGKLNSILTDIKSSKRYTW